MNILLGVSGSIAAYKSADIVSRLKKDGHNVHIILTNAASKFIGELTLQSLSKNKVYRDILVDDEPSKISHIYIPQSADLLIIAPASANIIGKIANGIADDMLSCSILAINDIPKLIAPAMNTNMYNSPAIKRNLNILKEDGWEIIKPRVSMLACGYEGEGALAEIDDIIKKVEGFK